MAAPTQTSPTSGATPGSRAVVAVVAVLVLIFVGSLFSIDVRPDPDASEHLANVTEFAEGTSAASRYSRDTVDVDSHSRPGESNPKDAAQGEEKDRSSTHVQLTQEMKNRLSKLGFSQSQLADMDSMPTHQVLQVLSAAKARIMELASQAASPESTSPAPMPSELEPQTVPAFQNDTPSQEDATLPQVEADMISPTPSNTPQEIETPKYDLAAIRSLTPPQYCFTAVNGEEAEPTTSRFKNPPSDTVALRIAELMATERPCWIYNRKCAEMGVNDTKGKPFWRKYSNPDATLQDVWENITPESNGSLGNCAVVGNADNLSDKGWGSQIDAHDFVVRYNVRTKGFEKDVGYKVDGLWTKDSYKIAETSTVKPTRYHMIPKLPPKNMEKIDGVPIMVYGPALAPWRAAAREIYFIYKKDRKITKGDPTGGWARMVSLVESGFCKRVDIYGFSSGGGKYFKRSQLVKEAHVVNVEHYTRRLMMALQLHGKVCVYGT
mmetsp:Transcript_14552/g.27970  ORF Transcript_14552/g.27970 Transcript_14552/m.27970 type:complete len:493 (+) Transcript_14552:154-1632(+)|eukprot:CAMPEP_0114247556 /NCGR_PEP_ID=MMETSP0058-20121206/13086_1 /TAXON_ID=36894 /ORGANISM="Pyramimonas parkeae, CCMP726" /LENGTH=492 /DNA_ID=CAMNT_0001360871 /DNA_START=148 /DNA_END=1626 /DNA_ORIENTATION=-